MATSTVEEVIKSAQEAIREIYAEILPGTSRRRSRRSMGLNLSNNSSSEMEAERHSDRSSNVSNTSVELQRTLNHINEISTSISGFLDGSPPTNRNESNAQGEVSVAIGISAPETATVSVTHTAGGAVSEAATGASSTDTPVTTIIDLCDIETPPPTNVRRGRRRINRPDSDFVICDFIDLSTPSSTPLRPSQRRLRYSDNGAPSVPRTNRSRSPDKQETIISVTTNTVSSSSDIDKTSHVQCPICLESAVSRQPTASKCGHVFCSECILMCLRNNKKCPICKTVLQQRNLHRLFI